MAMKDFDAKQFMLEKGERVGLGIALFLMVALILYNLFLPGKGFFSGSPSANAKVLADATDRVQKGIASAVPEESDKPPPIQGDLTSKYVVQPLTPEGFRLKNELFTPANPGSTKRRLPEVLLVKEAVVDANIK